jgi:uncharacterized coiled-coil DUF342 family protein
MTTPTETLVQISRVTYTGQRTPENIQLGCMQRIADAIEKMAVNQDRLIHDRDMYKRMYETARDTIYSQERSIRSLKGQITKLRKKVGGTQSETTPMEAQALSN